MKVEGPSSTTQAAHRRAAGLAAPGFALPMDNAQNASMAQRANATANIVNVGALLSLQELPETKEEKRKRATRRANDLLDLLDDIKVSTLSGNVNTGQLLQLKNALSNKSDEIDDPKLQQILEEIELRAEVELAKLERAQ